MSSNSCQKLQQTTILYQSPHKTTFIVDIPASIELAQTIGTQTGANPRKKKLYSANLKKPYPSPPEPKTDSARGRVLSRIPKSERSFLEAIDSFVKISFGQLQKERGQFNNWCYPRTALQDDGCEKDESVKQNETIDSPRKKRKLDIEEQELTTTANSSGPPIILSASSVNEFSSLADLQGVETRNPCLESVAIRVRARKDSSSDRAGDFTEYTIPPKSSFVLGTLSALSDQRIQNSHIIPSLPKTKKFNLILLDPPWPNRSVRRSSQYQIHSYLETDILVSIMQDIILNHLNRQSKEKALVGIWTTNNAKSHQAAHDAFELTGLEIFEEWIWLKVTEHGEPVVPLDGLWRKPYEVLLIGMPKGEDTVENKEPLKRLIVAVPDLHSRKPNLKELFARLHFATSHGTNEYMALEVFARNLTSGWYSCGNDVLRFNADQWWFDI